MQDPYERLKAIDRCLEEDIGGFFSNIGRKLGITKAPVTDPQKKLKLTGDQGSAITYQPDAESRARIQQQNTQRQERLASLRSGDPGFDSRAAKNARVQQRMQTAADAGGIASDVAGIGAGVLGMIAPEPTSTVAGAALATNRLASATARLDRLRRAVTGLGRPATRQARAGLAARQGAVGRAADAAKRANRAAANPIARIGSNRIAQIATAILPRTRIGSAIGTAINVSSLMDKKPEIAPEIAGSVRRKIRGLGDTIRGLGLGAGAAAGAAAGSLLGGGEKTPKSDQGLTDGDPAGTRGMSVGDQIYAVSRRAKDLRATSARR